MKKNPTQLYFVNAAVDFACIGLLSMLTLATFWLTTGGTLSHQAAIWSVYLSWVINWPHFSATNYRLFKRRENWREYPLTAFFVPVLVGAAIWASFAQPEAVAPFFVKIFLIWSPYHFSGQNVGLSLLYSRRAGFHFEGWERRVLTVFIFSTFLAPTLSAEAGRASAEYYQIFYPALNVPRWMGDLAWYSLYASGAGMVFAGMRRLVMRKAFFPLITLLPGAAQFFWFIVGWRVPSFYYFVPMFHSLQYLFIVWAMELAERRKEEGGKGWFFTWKKTAIWSTVNIAGGAALFAGLPKLAEMRGVPLPLATGVLIAGVQIHHFIVDGVIWKLRNPKVASPLMASVTEVATTRRKAA